MDVQRAFNLHYPFLRIEFSKKEDYFPNAKSRKVNPDNHINAIAELKAPTKVNVESTRTIAEIAREFADLLGVYIRVSRKSGNVWNVISLTDSWTLESQNKAGEFISTEMAVTSWFFAPAFP